MDEVEFQYNILGQYQGQLNSIDIRSPVARVDEPGKIQNLIDTFEDGYRRQYSEEARSPELGHTITQASVRGVRDVVKPEIPTEEVVGPEPPEDALKGSREAYWDGEWGETAVYDLHALNPGNELSGPAVLEGEATTYVVPPNYKSSLDKHRVHHLMSED
jgi:N-methylhydantoinase A/acetone carboxylase, beta subunit